MFKIAKPSTRTLTMLGLLLAADIVLTRFLSIQTPYVRISFSFLPVALAGMLYGPFWAGMCAAAADFLGANLFPAGAYFPGFTLSALLTGVIYGVLLYRCNAWPRVAAAVLCISLAVSLCLNTYWLTFIFADATYIGILPGRIVQSVLMAPAQILLIRAVSARLRLVPQPQAAGRAT